MRTAILCACLIVVPACAARGLVNLSARASTAAGPGALTAGFVIAGDAPKRVLVRAAGPSLTAFGVAGALPQVRLDVFHDVNAVAGNSGWDAGGNASAVTQAAGAAGAFAFAPGSGDAALLLDLAPGSYTAMATPAGGADSTGVALIEVYDAEPGSRSRLVNLSARARAGAGGETFIAGFAIAGEDRNRILVRGIGPALAAFGVSGALSDPQIEVFRDGVSLGYNDDWRASGNAVQLAQVARDSGAFALPDGAKDAALVLGGGRGACTAHVTAASGAGGVALIEIYDTAGRPTLPPPRAFDLVGFARVPGHGLAAMTGGGSPAIAYDPVARSGNYWRIDDATIAAAGAAFASQLQAAFASDVPLVIELNTMIDLSRFGRPNNGNPATTHPELFAAGRTTGIVGTLAIGSNKTIYSAFGTGGFRRGTLTIGGTSNIMLRNLTFRELWEWDDATRGDYDRNGWDYLVISSVTSGPNVVSHAHHVWIDHCDFEKAYDGLFDVVHGADLMTVSWCKLGGAVSGESVRWVQRQLQHLEANRSSFPYYDSQRALFSVAELLRRETFQKKSNLVGNATDPATTAHDTGFLNVTFHHNAYLSVDQRMPRMRFGNAHVFNLLADSAAGRNVSGLSLAGVAATSNAAVLVEDSRFIDLRTPVANTVGTAEPLGRVAVRNSVNLDALTGVDKGFDPARTVPIASFQWNRPAARSGLGTWPLADPTTFPSGYVPAGRVLSEYVDAHDYLPANLAQVGVIVPADAAEADRLRRYLQATTAPR